VFFPKCLLNLYNLGPLQRPPTARTIQHQQFIQDYFQNLDNPRIIPLDLLDKYSEVQIINRVEYT